MGEQYGGAMSTPTAEQIQEARERLAETERTFRLLHEPDAVFEIRALNVGKVPIVSGYFDDIQKAVKAVATVELRRPKGVYVTLNPCDPALMARANNRLVEWAKNTTSDTEIVRRRWLMVDIDPVRPSGICATDAEKKTALALGIEIEDLLRARGWSYPLTVDSGNGMYLLYKIDLPNTNEVTALLKRFFAGLATLLSRVDPNEPHSLVDRAVFNAARLVRVGGTINRKGDATADRPHRPCVWNEPIAECPVEVIH